MTTLEAKFTHDKTLLASWVVAAQNGDREAFGRLVERYERAVYATALRRLGNHAEAQELTQEVFLQAMRKIGQLHEPAAFGGWLRSITTRMAINRATRRGPMISAEPETLEATCVERDTPLVNTLAKERDRQVRAGLGRLRRLDRETLVAFYVKGQSLVEMSDSFDAPVGTIKRRLHIARKRLAEELEELAPA
jgi:RNA polymerase sigma-70 factor (ECF subfamily)